MSLLTIIQTVAPRFGIPAPSIAASSTDQNVVQLTAFVNEAGQELAKRHSWQALTNEATFTTLATEIQGTLTTLTGADYSFIVNETMWNRTQRRPVFGPKSPAEWQQLKAQTLQGPWQQYRIRGNNILFLPAPAAGQSIYFEWVSQNWVTTATATTANVMTADTDVSKLEERLLALDTVWRFQAAKKLDYTESFNKAEEAISDAITRDGPKPRLQLEGSGTDILPVVVVPSGNWGV